VKSILKLPLKVMLTSPVNEILGDHNVDKQITDNKGDVRHKTLDLTADIDPIQVAYLMADISNVKPSEIKEISDSLEALSCKFSALFKVFGILMKPSSNHDAYTLLVCQIFLRKWKIGLHSTGVEGVLGSNQSLQQNKII
jgi:hypothetical protein